ncbi:MAG: hypothetical protein RJB24_415 [Candidatus Parcubacteria bacterium]|jgi:hypothetical protein
MRNKIKLLTCVLIGLSIPFLIRTTILAYPIAGVNSPYLTIYLHSLDIILALIFGYLIWSSKNFPLSSSKIVDKLWITLFFWIFMQLLWAQYPLITWVWGVRLYLLAGIIRYIIRSREFIKEITWVGRGFVVGMLGQALIVMTQMLLQKNIGLPLVVESTLSRELAGVAKVSILDNILIRAYGTFPHPNILAFAGIMALILVYTRVVGQKQAVMLYILTLVMAGMFDHYILTSIQSIIIVGLVGISLNLNIKLDFAQNINKIIIVLLHTLIILAFSKLALVLLLITDCIYLTYFWNKKMFYVEQFQNKLKSLPRIIINSVALIGIAILWILPYQQILDTILKRIFYLQDAFVIIQSNLLLGVGLGQYVVNLSENREFWQYEPVHNVLVLLLSELGLVGVFILIAIIVMGCYTTQYGYKK